MISRVCHGKGIGAGSKEQVVFYMENGAFPASHPAGNIVCGILLGQGGDSFNNGQACKDKKRHDYNAGSDCQNDFFVNKTFLG